MPTPDLFDFLDAEALANYDEARVRQVLVEHPSLYVNHLEIAQHLNVWADRLEEDRSVTGSDFHKGFIHAIRDVAAHLRQGDYTPGAAFIRQARTLHGNRLNVEALERMEQDDTLD